MTDLHFRAFLFSALFLLFFASPLAATSIDLGDVIAADSSISREAREILDVLYPGTPPPEEAIRYTRKVLLAFHLDSCLEQIKRGQFKAASDSLSQSVHGVEWTFSPLELFQVLDGYKAPNAKEIPTDASAAHDVADLRKDYDELRKGSFRKLLETGKPLTFAELHAWITEGEVVLSSFVSARPDFALPWEALSRSELADLRSLLKGAREAEEGGGTKHTAARRSLTKAYLRHNLERFTVFNEFRLAAENIKKKFSAFLKASELVIPIKVIALEGGNAVEEAMVSFAGGILGNQRSDKYGNANFAHSFDKVSRRLGGDGWVPLSVYLRRIEVLYTNMNINSMLQLSKHELKADGQGSIYRTPAKTFKVSRAGTTLKVKVTCPVPSGMIGELSSAVVTLSGQKPIETELNKVISFSHLYAGDYLLSVEGKDDQRVTFKTAAKVVTIAPGETPGTVTIELPSSDALEPRDQSNVNVVIKAFEENKNRLMNNKLEVKEYRKVQGLLFRYNRKTLGGPGIRQAMESLKKISVGLKYKSEGMNVFKRIQSLEKKLKSVKSDLPQKLMKGQDLRGNLMQLVERYSSENFDLEGDKEYLFLARYRHYLERAQSNHQELVVTLGNVATDIVPKVDSIKKAVKELMTEYCGKYQLVKFTVGLTHDADFHKLLVEDLLPLERLIDETKQLTANGFLESYERQVKQLQRVVQNRQGTLKIVKSNLDERLKRYKEYADRKLSPLRSKIKELSEKGVMLSKLDRLSDLAHFADPKARVIESQQNSFIDILRQLAEAKELQIPGGVPGPTTLEGPVVAHLAKLLPSLELNVRLSRNQEEAQRLRDDYNHLLRSNLLEIFDVTTPEEEIRKLFTKDRYQRKKEVNSATGELSSSLRAPDLLLKDVPKKGMVVNRIAKDIVGLYIFEIEQRRVRDSALLAGTKSVLTVLEEVDKDVPGSLAKLSRELSSLQRMTAPPPRGGLHFPRLTNDCGPQVDTNLQQIRTGLTALISNRYRKPSVRFAELAERLNPMKMDSEPPEAEMKEAKRLLAIPPDPAINGVIEHMNSMKIPVGKAYAVWKANRTRLKDYLEQLGAY